MGTHSFREFSGQFHVGDYVTTDDAVVGVMAIVDPGHANEAPEALQVMTPQGEVLAFTEVCRSISADTVAVPRFMTTRPPA